MGIIIDFFLLVDLRVGLYSVFFIFEKLYCFNRDKL